MEGSLTGVDMLAALRLQIEWGADEAIVDAPHNRLTVPPSGAPALPPRPQPTAAARPIRADAAAKAKELAEAASTLPELCEAIQAFTLCPLRDTAAHTVLPIGPLEAPLILVGDAPNAPDDAAGQFYSGAIGEFLDRVLNSAGLTRAGLLIVPLLPWRPPGDRPPSTSELAACRPFLERLIALAPAQHALVLSPVATRALFGPDRRIRRGAWTELAIAGRARPLNVLPSVSVSQARTNGGMKRELWACIRRLMRVLQQ